jgi:hypothetical protein
MNNETKWKKLKQWHCTSLYLSSWSIRRLQYSTNKALMLLILTVLAQKCFHCLEHITKRKFNTENNKLEFQVIFTSQGFQKLPQLLPPWTQGYHTENLRLFLFWHGKTSYMGHHTYNRTIVQAGHVEGLGCWYCMGTAWWAPGMWHYTDEIRKINNCGELMKYQLSKVFLSKGVEQS